MLVMDKQDYMETAKNVLEQPMNIPFLADPTNKYTAKLVNILKRIQKESGMDDNKHRRRYPTGVCSPHVLRSSKIHKRTAHSGP